MAHGAEGRLRQTVIGKTTTDKVEKLKASVRAKVELLFRVIKGQFGHVKVHYRGLKMNTAQLVTLFLRKAICGWCAAN